MVSEKTLNILELILSSIQDANMYPMSFLVISRQLLAVQIAVTRAFPVARGELISEFESKV